MTDRMKKNGKGQKHKKPTAEQIEALHSLLRRLVSRGPVSLSSLGELLHQAEPSLSPADFGMAKVSTLLAQYASDLVQVKTADGVASAFLAPGAGDSVSRTAGDNKSEEKPSPQKWNRGQQAFRAAVRAAVTAGGAMTLAELGSALGALRPAVTAKTAGRAKLSGALQQCCADLVVLVGDRDEARVTPLPSLSGGPAVQTDEELTETTVTMPDAEAVQASVKSLLADRGVMGTDVLRGELEKLHPWFSPKAFGYGTMKTYLKGALGTTVQLTRDNRSVSLAPRTAPASKPQGWVWKEEGKTVTLSDSELMERLRELTLRSVLPGESLKVSELVAVLCRQVPRLSFHKLGFDRWDGLIEHLSDQLTSKGGRVWRAAPQEAQPKQAAAPGPLQKRRSAEELEALFDDLVTEPMPLPKLAAALQKRDPTFRPSAWGAPNLKTLVQRSLSHRLLLNRRNNADWVAPLKAGGVTRPVHAAVHAPRREKVKIYDLPFGKVFLPEDLLETLVQTALPERWDFGDDHRFSILKTYLEATMRRLDAQGGMRLDAERGVGAFHTGLIDTNYEDLYAYLTKEGQGWEVRSFCLAGQALYGKMVSRSFSPLPPRAAAPDPALLAYPDPSRPPQVDWNHVLIDRVSRIPLEVLRSAGLDVSGTEGYLTDVMSVRHARTQLRGDAVAHRRLKALFEAAIDQTLKRLHIDYRLAVPLYRMSNNSVSLALPLDLSSANRIDTALIVEPLGDGEVLGHTIYPLRWVYSGARALYRPTVAWLDPKGLLPVPEFDAFVPEGGQGAVRPPKAESGVAAREGLWDRVTGWLRRK